MLSAKEHFSVFDFVNRAICVIEYRRDSPIVYVNREFATLLESHPERLEGRSLDEITLADQLHFEAVHPLLVKRNFVISVLGGFVINCYLERTKERFMTTLKVTKIQVEKYEGGTYLIGYVRTATVAERWINRLRLDTQLDPYIKPILNFFVAGKWRPIATVTAPFWGPAIARHAPEIYEAVNNIQL